MKDRSLFDLSALHEKRLKCIGILYNGTNHVYAFNGAPEKNSLAIRKAISYIDGVFKNPHRVEVDKEGTFTIFPLIKIYNETKNLVKDIDNIYARIYSSGSDTVNLDIIDVGLLRYNGNLIVNEGYEHRIFSCVERKLLHWCYINKTFIPKIYVTKRPCELCILCVPNCVYIDEFDGKIHGHVLNITRNGINVKWEIIKTR